MWIFNLCNIGDSPIIAAENEKYSQHNTFSTFLSCSDWQLRQTPQKPFWATFQQKNCPTHRAEQSIGNRTKPKFYNSLTRTLRILRPLP